MLDGNKTIALEKVENDPFLLSKVAPFQFMRTRAVLVLVLVLRETVSSSYTHILHDKTNSVEI